jgi:hypothetical protein
MSILHAMRHCPLFARLALLWFVASLGVAIASPLVNPQGSMALVCNAGGGVKLVSTDDGSTGAALHTLDCPLCANSSAPPQVASVLLESQQALGHVLQSIPAARIAALTAAPLPARGPPTSF